MPTQRRIEELFSTLFRAHPWHGVSPATDVADEVLSYVEIVPTDAVKYEADKPTGILRVDRPQRYSNVCPTLYGFVPQTYCGDRVGARCSERTGVLGVRGDGDPLDVCILSERPIAHGDILLRARIIGGLRMVDALEADDKLIAVLVGDAVYGEARDIGDCPPALLDRLRHYFLSYKQLPGAEPRRVTIAETYDRAEALEVLRRSLEDYRARHGTAEGRLSELFGLLGLAAAREDRS